MLARVVRRPSSQPICGGGGRPDGRGDPGEHALTAHEFARTHAKDPSELAGEVIAVLESDTEGCFRDVELSLSQEFRAACDPQGNQIGHRRLSCGFAKNPEKVAPRHVSHCGELLDIEIMFAVGFHEVDHLGDAQKPARDRNEGMTVASRQKSHQLQKQGSRHDGEARGAGA